MDFDHSGEKRWLTPEPIHSWTVQSTSHVSAHILSSVDREKESHLQVVPVVAPTKHVELNLRFVKILHLMNLALELWERRLQFILFLGFLGVVCERKGK